MIGIETRMMGPPMGLIMFFLVYKGSPKLLESFNSIIAVMAIVFVTTMFVAKPGVGEILYCIQNSR